MQQGLIEFLNSNDNDYELKLNRIELEEDYAIYECAVIVFSFNESGTSIIRKKANATAKVTEDEAADFIDAAQDKALSKALSLLGYTE